MVAGPQTPASPTSKSDTAALDILVLCAANQARSPVLAWLLQQEAARRTGDGFGPPVRHAGLRAEEGLPLLPTMADAITKRGFAPFEHRSRQVTDSDILGSDLIITMTEDQRRAVNRVHPDVVERTYTLLEIDRLTSAPEWEAEWDGDSRLAAHLQRLRPLVPRAGNPEDVEDPATGGRRLSLVVLDELVTLTRRVGGHLFGSTAQ